MKIVNTVHQSPALAHEWRILHDVLGLELLTRLVGVSESSARRYMSGSRSTPDSVADRLHFLVFVVDDLAGAYNDVGVRRWFERKRSRLHGATPAKTLGTHWSSADDGPRRVQELASALRASPAT